MKKLIMFLMVLMLCLGFSATAKAALVAGYSFDGDLCDQEGTYDAVSLGGTEAYGSGNVGSEGLALEFTGDDWYELPVNPCIFEGDNNFSIVFWFKTSQEGAILMSASSEGGAACGGENSMAIFVLNYTGDIGKVSYDHLCIDGTATDTAELNDGAWHHYAVTYTASGNVFKTYIDAVADGDGAIGFDPTFSCAGTTVTLGNVINSGWFSEMGGDAADGPYIGLLKDVGIYNHALTVGEISTVKGTGFSCQWNPIVADANDVTIYESRTTPMGDHLGNIYVSLKKSPVASSTVTVVVDPNGPVGGQGNPDYNLLGNSGAPDYTVTLTFTDSTWDTKQLVKLESVQDSDNEAHPEPPDTMMEEHKILLTSSSSLGAGDPCMHDYEKGATVVVVDDDQPDIIFTVAAPGQTYEYKYCTLWFNGCIGSWLYYPQTVGVSLQTPPKDGGLVKITMGLDTMGTNNPPTVNPDVWDDPNYLVFSVDGATYKGIPTRQWDNPLNIDVQGTDDYATQAEGEAEGGQNYTVELVFHIEESGYGQPWDPGYGDYEEGVWEDKIEKRFLVNIEDNDCGAFGTLNFDISNPYYVMTEAELGALLGNDRRDPNDWMDSNGIPGPDCHVDMYDLLELAWRWVDCSDPQALASRGEGDCTSYIVE
jgi:hypothetical protein